MWLCVCVCVTLLPALSASWLGWKEAAGGIFECINLTRCVCTRIYPKVYTHTHTHNLPREVHTHTKTYIFLFFFFPSLLSSWLCASSWGVRKTNGLVTPHPSIPPKSILFFFFFFFFFVLFLDRFNLFIYIFSYFIYLLRLLLNFYFTLLLSWATFPVYIFVVLAPFHCRHRRRSIFIFKIIIKNIHVNMTLLCHLWWDACRQSIIRALCSRSVP